MDEKKTQADGFCVFFIEKKKYKKQKKTHRWHILRVKHFHPFYRQPECEKKQQEKKLMRKCKKNQFSNSHPCKQP